jgi:hypothetical protein
VKLLAEFRESTFFKLVSDISVGYWVFTIVPGLIASAKARLHGNRPETVILYFVGVSALMFAALHYGSLAWTKYFAPIEKGVVGKLPGHLRQLLIPTAALLIVIIFSVWPKRQPATNIPPLPPTPREALTTDNQTAKQQESTQTPLRSQSRGTNQKSKSQPPGVKIGPDARSMSINNNTFSGFNRGPAIENQGQIDANNNRFYNEKKKGSVTFLDNAGEIQKAAIGKLTIKGAPAFGTNTVAIKNESSGKIGSLSVDEAYMYLPSNDVVPPAPPSGTISTRAYLI